MESTNSIHNGKPYWAKRQQPPKKTYFLYWQPNKNTWFISETLGSTSGIVFTSDEYKLSAKIMSKCKIMKYFPSITFLTIRSHVYGEKC